MLRWPAWHIRTHAAALDKETTKRATYRELESITCDLTAFPQVEFWRVEVRTVLAWRPHPHRSAVQAG